MQEKEMQDLVEDGAEFEFVDADSTDGEVSEEEEDGDVSTGDETDFDASSYDAEGVVDHSLRDKQRSFDRE